MKLSATFGNPRVYLAHLYDLVFPSTTRLPLQLVYTGGIEKSLGLENESTCAESFIDGKLFPRNITTEGSFSFFT